MKYEKVSPTPPKTWIARIHGDGENETIDLNAYNNTSAPYYIHTKKLESGTADGTDWLTHLRYKKWFDYKMEKVFIWLSEEKISQKLSDVWWKRFDEKYGDMTDEDYFNRK